MTEPQWYVELLGSESDLELWRRILPEGFHPAVVIRDTNRTPPEPSVKFLLVDSTFDSVDGAKELRELAVPLVRRLITLISISERETDVRVGAFYRRTDGIFIAHHILQAEGGIEFSIRARMTVTGQSSSKGSADPQPTFAQAFANPKNADLAAALEYLGLSETWHNLYRAYEALPGKSKKEVLLQAGLSKDQFDQFVGSASKARHHRGHTFYGELLSVKQGRHLLLRVILHLLEKS